MPFHIAIIKFAVISAIGLVICFNVQSGPAENPDHVQRVSDSLVYDYLRNFRYEEALRIVIDHNNRIPRDRQSQIHWLIRTADIHYSLGNLKSGNDLLKRIESIIRPSENPGSGLLFHYAFLKGRSCYFAGESQKALEWFRISETHIGGVSGLYPAETAALLAEIGYMQYKLTAYREAIRYFEKAIKDLTGTSSVDLHEKILLKARIAESYWKMREMDKADRLFSECLGYLNSTPDPLHPALLNVYLILNNYAFNFLDNYATSKNLLRNATMILEKGFPPEHFYAGILYTKKAQLQYALSDFENAVQYSQHALNILSKYVFLHSYLNSNYLNIALFYYWVEGDYDKCIRFSRRAIEGLNRSGSSAADFYFLIGTSFLKLDNESMAVENLRKVISLTAGHKSNHDNFYCCRAYHLLGDVYLTRHDTATGRRYLRTALNYAKRIGEKGYAVVNINHILGSSYFKDQDYRKALQYFQRSLIGGCNAFSDTFTFANPVPEDIAFAQNVIKTLTEKAYTLYLIYENDATLLSYLENALKCQELAVKLIEKRIVDIDEERSGLVIADLRKRAMNNAVSYAVLMFQRTGEKQYADKAWEFAEKSKMQVLTIHAMKENNLAFSGIPDSLILRWENLNHRIRNAESRLSMEEGSQDLEGSGQTAIAGLARLYDDREELKAKIEKEYPAYRQLKYNFTVAGFEDLQKHLEKDQVIVEFQMLSTEIITFVITRDDYFILFRLIDKQVPDAIRKLRTSCTISPLNSDPAASFQSFVESSHYLYTQLIEPVYEKIRGKRLIIIPHNQLTQVPFEVLIREKPAAGMTVDYRPLRYLVREFPVSYAFSANLLIDRDHRKYGSNTAIFVPDYNSAGKEDMIYSALAGAAFESRTIRRLTGGRLFNRDKADELTFKTRAPRYRILHIASHAVMDEKNSDLSYLIMTAPVDTPEDGNLYSYEISQMELKAQLVVLSGCNTGYGLLRQSEGLISIARSFLYTGIRSVAYTLWPLSDKTGSDLVCSFYQAIRSRQTLDKAMRTAKLSFLENADPVRSHPFYWAGYVIAGRTESVPVFGMFYWIMLGAAAITITSVFWFMYRKIRF